MADATEMFTNDISGGFGGQGGHAHPQDARSRPLPKWIIQFYSCKWLKLTYIACLFIALSISMQ